MPGLLLRTKYSPGVSPGPFFPWDFSRVADPGGHDPDPNPSFEKNGTGCLSRDSKMLYFDQNSLFVYIDILELLLLYFNKYL